MADLYERLRAIQQHRRSGATRPTSEPARGAPLRHDAPAPASEARLDADLPATGQWVAVADRLWARRWRYPLPFVVPASSSAAVTRAIARRFRDFGLESSPPPQDLVFWDTETTGLSGGAGTVIFLSGFGRADFAAGRAVVDQFFLADYAAESAFLDVHTARFAAASAVVSYNGKSFDWPLLRSRYVLNRLSTPNFEHLDLLHPVRRVLRHSMPSCSLTTVEQTLFGLYRLGDIPGDQIPDRYFAWLRQYAPAPGIQTPQGAQAGDPSKAGGLQAVFNHHAHDIAGLIAVLAFLLVLVDEPARVIGRAPVALDAVGLFRWLVRNDPERARASLVAGLADSRLAPAMRRATWRELAAVEKRRGDWSAAVTIWQTLAGSEPPDGSAVVELAKYLEHQCKNPAGALSMLQRLGPLQRADPAVRHRTQRLEQKTARPTSPERR